MRAHYRIIASAGGGRAMKKSTASPRTRSRNQRFSNTRQRRQQHLLNVKMRARKATQHRNRRILVFLAKIVLTVAICVGICVGAQLGIRHFFFENPDYNLVMIDVRTDGTLQREQVLKETDLHEGENIFRVNLAQVHNALEQLPQVDEVEVVRKMPGEIDIRITERKPIAWITSEKQISDPFQSDVAFLIDARGALMKEKKLLPEYLGLPLITGCTSDSLEAGKIVESVEAKAALELLRLSAASFMQTRFQVREIDISKGYCLIVTDKNRTRVTLGFDHLDQQIQRLEQFLVYADDSKRDIETVNLMVARNIPVTFMKPANEVINDTIDPEETPRVMKAIPLHPSPAAKASAKPPAEKTQNGPQPFSLRKEEQQKEKRNGE
jgi:cell division septal protein FtsQ